MFTTNLRSAMACCGLVLLLATKQSTASSNESIQRKNRASKKSSVDLYKISSQRSASKGSTTGEQPKSKSFKTTQMDFEDFEDLELVHSISMSYAEVQKALSYSVQLEKKVKSSKKGSKKKKRNFKSSSDKTQETEPSSNKSKDKTKKPKTRKNGSPTSAMPSATPTTTPQGTATGSPTVSPTFPPTVFTQELSTPSPTAKSSSRNPSLTPSTTIPMTRVPTTSLSPSVTIQPSLPNLNDDDNNDDATSVPDIAVGDIDDTGLAPLIGGIAGLLVLILCSLAFLSRKKRSEPEDEPEV